MKFRIHFTVNAFRHLVSDYVDLEGEDPKDIRDKFDQWLDKRGLSRDKLEDYWSEKI